ncbi:Uncharacterised protein [Shewanella morhuae]|uniref:Uncharacterized protein n=1 Tax=Shewanella morhuae TaxID=365591 RepID=A0A380B449_9GAMM|nr:Uncharacterised protein [Shewanella morhuae]
MPVDLVYWHFFMFFNLVFMLLTMITGFDQIKVYIF